MAFTLCLRICKLAAMRSMIVMELSCIVIHVDRAVAVSRGLDGPFVHDLCAYGYACRLAIAGLFPGQPVFAGF